MPTPKVPVYGSPAYYEQLAMSAPPGIDLSAFMGFPYTTEQLEEVYRNAAMVRLKGPSQLSTGNRARGGARIKRAAAFLAGTVTSMFGSAIPGLGGIERTLIGSALYASARLYSVTYGDGGSFGSFASGVSFGALGSLALEGWSGLRDLANALDPRTAIMEPAVNSIMAPSIAPWNAPSILMW